MAAIHGYEELRKELDAEALMRTAREKSGLADDGDESFVKPFAKFLDCVASGTKLHAQGLKELKDEMVRILVNRLRFQEDLKRHPEILDEDVSDPIVILGMARSGTTKTQRMVGTDPNLLKTYMWQLMHPAPFPNAVPGQPDPRIAAGSFFDFDLDQVKPELQAGHHFAADNVDEDWQLFDFTLNDWYANARTFSPSWVDWVSARQEPSDLSNYRYVGSLFQYLQWQQGGKRGRKWLMKNCGHIAHMEELLAVFPQATLMHIHRHPADFIASWSKLMLYVWGLRADDVEPARVGEVLLGWSKSWLDKYMADRDRLGLNERIFDVQYDQIRNDPMPAIEEVYRRAGHVLTPASAQGMLQWERDNEQGKHGKHIYSLEEFGLSRQKIDDAFGAYIARFFNR